MLDTIPGMRLVGLSRWFESAPVPPSGQPPYVNAIAALAIAIAYEYAQRREPVREVTS